MAAQLIIVLLKLESEIRLICTKIKTVMRYKSSAILLKLKAISKQLDNY